MHLSNVRTSIAIKRDDVFRNGRKYNSLSSTAAVENYLLFTV